MESDEIGHPRVLVLDSKQMWLDAALLAPKGAFFAYSFSCVISRNRDVFSTDLLSEPLLRVFDSGRQILCHCQSSLPFNKPMLLWSSFFIINIVTGIQKKRIHCSVEFLVSEAHTLSIGHRIGTLGSLPSIRIGVQKLLNASTVQKIHSLPGTLLSMLLPLARKTTSFYQWPQDLNHS